MKTSTRLTLAALLLAGGWQLRAQTATPSPTQPAKAASEEETITLTPFEVTASKDNGYQATETLAGTRIRTNLRDVGAAISVITKEFLQDVGATDNSTLLQYTPNAEVAGTRGTYAGLGNGGSVDETGNLRAPGGAQRVRGLAAADNTRDFFVTDIPWDSFNIDRIDIQRGPNSILFGLGSPAGIVNASTRSADYNKSGGSFEARVGSYGSVRGSLDFNQIIIPKVLAFRFDGLTSKEQYQQEQAFQNDKRYYGAMRWDPQFFKDPSFHTTIKAKYEQGDIKANRPRIVPPADSLTPWFRALNTSSIDGGAGKFSVNNGYEIGAAPSSANPWLISDSIANQQQPIWFLDGTSGSLMRIYGGYINTGARNNDGSDRGAANNLIGQRYASQFFGMSSLSSYANNVKLPGYQFGQYRQSTLGDASVFDFYNNLIDGPTKNEFEKWDAYNVSIVQTGWDDRFAAEFNWDKQKYKRGGQALLNNPTLNIDVLRNFQDLNANPNYGRPYVIGGPGSGNSYQSQREYVRASVFGEIRSSDFVDRDSMLARFLGKHRFNGVFSKEQYETETRTWQMYATNQAWDAFWTRTAGNTSGISDRPPVGIIYLGPTLANLSTAAGANVPSVTGNVVLPDGNIYINESTWKATGVNFGDPWTVPSNLTPIFNTASPPAGGFTQASNPANYVGWNSNRQIELLRYDNGNNPSLLTGSQKSYRVTRSFAGSWQGYLWNEAIVATLGWRYDEVKGKGVTAQSVSTNRKILNLDPTIYTLPGIYPANQIFSDHSTSGGVVVHVNRLFGKDTDPLPINVSLSYNKSANFQVTDVRRDIYGNPIGNPTGDTKDYGILLSTKDGKYSFRAVKYETNAINASIQSNIVSLVGASVRQGLRFRNVFLYRMSLYDWGSREQTNLSPGQRYFWTPAYINSAGRPVADLNGSPSIPGGTTLETQAQADAHRDASIRAWNDIQKYLAGKGYFAYWGYTPTTASALTDRATYEATLTMTGSTDGKPIPAAQYMPDTATLYAYGYTSPQPQGLTMTADTLSKGYEFELTANPTRNWRVAFNASQTTAVRNNVGGAALADFISYMDAQMAGVAGDMRQFNGNYVPNNEVRQNWANDRANYTLLTLQQGASAPEIRKWRYNVITNYSFRDGFLKGAGVGASYRWQDKVVIGYPVIANPTNPALGSFDLSQPYYGPSEDGFDAWLSYERKITEKVSWRIQLNGRNLFGKEELIPISVQSDGKTWASMRIAPNREWFLTNTFSF